jgi:hypothetical protein
MGSDQIRYLIFLSGRWRWRPTAAMRARGFRLVSFGRELTPDDRARAVRLNAEWDAIRAGEKLAEARVVFPHGSVGHGYERAVALRREARDQEARGAKAKPRGSDQTSRDDWPRAWKWIGPVFGDTDPKLITPENLIALRATVAARVSAGEAHRVIKVWRALWKKMAAMGYCRRDADPSLLFANTAPPPRQAVWREEEVRRLIKQAWRLDYRGLAALLAVAWDTQLSPVDVRSLTAGQMVRDGKGTMFAVARAKTGRAALGTLRRPTLRILRAYLAALGCELLDASPLFRTRGRPPGIPGGGKPWAPRPYTKDKLADDFAVIRAAAFGKDERRQLQDFRRSGAVEAIAGGADPASMSAKMANTLSASNRLHRTYVPVDASVVRLVDDARARGRALIREQKPDKSVITSGEAVSYPKTGKRKKTDISGR